MTDTYAQSFRQRYARLIRASRFALGITVGMLFVVFQIVPEPVWVPITIGIVMASDRYAGGVTRKTLHRAIATSLGCGLGLAYILIPDDHLTTVTLALGAIVAFVSGYFLDNAKVSYAAMLSTISFVIVASAPHEAGTVFAIWMIINIYIGGVIGLLLTKLVLPESARQHFTDELSTTMRLFGTLIAEQKSSALSEAELFEREETIITEIRRQTAILSSAELESHRWYRAADDFRQLNLEQRRFIRHFVGLTPEDNQRKLDNMQETARGIYQRYELRQKLAL